MAARLAAHRSLESRALALLARREFSRAELRARLIPHAQSEAEIEALLDGLVRRKLLSDQRFVESLVRRRAGRYGIARIRHDLSAHQLEPEQLRQVLQTLSASEMERAREVWRKRFGEPAQTREERLRQMRFLSARGFAADVVRRVVTGAGED
jgi:regulatory protein